MILDLGDISNYAFGIISKVLGSFFLAYRFILLKELDSIYDDVREKDDAIDQADWDKVFEALQKDIYFYGKSWAIHKKDLYQYLAIVPSSLFDVVAMLFLPFTLFGALNVCAIIIYEILLVYILSDPVDLNEWVAVLFLSASTAALATFSPDPSTPLRHVDLQFGFMEISLEWDSMIFIGFLVLAKMISFFYLRYNIDIMIEKKDNEEVSDHYQPRPSSLYNLMGPLHLAVNGAIWVLFIKAVLNATDESNTQRKIAYGILFILAFVIAGIGCAWGCAHSFHDMIGELHSATVFPVFVLLQTGLSVLTGIICFLEVPVNIFGFWFSFLGLMISIFAFVCVMEYNEPHAKFEEPLLQDASASQPSIIQSSTDEPIANAV